MHIHVISKNSPASAQDVAVWSAFTTLLQIVSVIVAFIGEANAIVVSVRAKDATT
jgi:hypothetical protein